MTKWLLAVIVSAAAHGGGLVAVAGAGGRSTPPSPSAAAAEPVVDLEAAPEPAPHAERPERPAGAAPVGPRRHDVPRDRAAPQGPSIARAAAPKVESAPAAERGAPPAAPGGPDSAPTRVRISSRGAGTEGGSAGRGGNAATSPALLPEESAGVPARLLARAKAAYPSAARAAGIEADVGLLLAIDASGAVTDARVVAPAGHGFDAAALGSVRAYRFEPAKRQGLPVSVRMHWVVQFRLQ